MKKLIIALVFVITYNATSQERNWTTKTTKDGKSIVKYELIKEKEGTHFYYTAESNVNVSLEDLETYFSNSENHKKFLERTPKTEEVNKISDNEWIIYYYFDAPWPMSDSDVVAKITRVKEENKIVFTANAISNDYKKTDVYRLRTYTFIYEFEKINSNTTKISISADYIPGGSVPNFLIKTWFPEGPAKIVSKLGLRE